MTERLALFLDVDNLQIEATKRGLPFQVRYIVERLREEGIIAVARAYADWSAHRHTLRDFDRHGFELTELPLSVRGKNTADVQIAVDALELALTAALLDTIVLVSGDRDFVPLVQKLKRYGKRVVGVGLNGSTSPVLRSLCDAYIFYDDLVPAAKSMEEGTQPRTDLTPVYRLMLQAVIAVTRQGQPALGSATGGMMKQLDPTFDASRHGKTFKELALAAQEHGYIVVHNGGGADLRLEPRSEALAARDRGAVLTLRFDTTDEALDSYRLLLDQRRVPLIPWAQREPLVRHLWDRLAAAPAGLTLTEMAGALTAFADQHAFEIPLAALQKLTFTLNIGACFSLDDVSARYHTKLDPAADRLRPMVPIDMAIEVMHQVYVKGFLRTDPTTPLLADPLALLLFEEVSEDTLRRITATIAAVEADRPDPAAVAPSPAPAHLTEEDLERDYQLLRRAVIEVRVQGRRATGSLVKAAMQSLDAGFDLGRHECGFKQFVERAAGAGRVRLAGPAGGDFLIEIEE